SGISDVVLVILGGGYSALTLRQEGKSRIAIVLNPLSRTSRVASVTIVDNIVRAVPALIKSAKKMKALPESQLEEYISGFNNETNLANSIRQIIQYLQGWTED